MPAEPWDEVRLVLCDPREDVVTAWKQQFEEKHPDVEVRAGDALESDADALLVPGNAFGFLDRGFELTCCETFGWELQDALRAKVRGDFFGELLVGQACFAPTGREGPLPHVIYAPIYRSPQSIDSTLNAYLAVRGALLLLRRGEGPPGIGSLVVPGLGTGNAGLHPVVMARQLRYAWEVCTGQRGFGDKNASQLRRREQKLRSIPKWILEGDEGPVEEA